LFTWWSSCRICKPAKLLFFFIQSWLVHLYQSILLWSNLEVLSMYALCLIVWYLVYTRLSKTKKTENLIFKVQKTPSPMPIIMDMMTDAHTGAIEVTKSSEREDVWRQSRWRWLSCLTERWDGAGWGALGGSHAGVTWQ
jgi:hypothetical protein